MANNNYPYYPQNPGSQPYLRAGMNYMEQPQPQLIIKGRPVSSIEEARATSIDFDGSIFYFPDLANKKIYTKQINMDGTATLNIYEWKSEPIPNTPQYVTREEFDNVLGQIKQALLEKEKDPSPKEEKFNF